MIQFGLFELPPAPFFSFTFLLPWSLYDSPLLKSVSQSESRSLCSMCFFSQCQFSCMLEAGSYCVALLPSSFQSLLLSYLQPLPPSFFFSSTFSLSHSPSLVFNFSSSPQLIFYQVPFKVTCLCFNSSPLLSSLCHISSCAFFKIYI